MCTTVEMCSVAGCGTGTSGLRGRLSSLAARWRQRFELHHIRAGLRALPDWVLHDIGVERSDIGDLATRLLRDSRC